jgi:hypothetical protein
LISNVTQCSSLVFTHYVLHFLWNVQLQSCKGSDSLSLSVALLNDEFSAMYATFSQTG